MTHEYVMKELLLSGAPEIKPDVKARGRHNTGRTWAAMAVTAVVAGAAWFVIQSEDSGNDASPRTLAGRAGTPQKQSAAVTVETAAMEIRGKVHKPGK
jgi:hypothetical protein